MTLVIPHREIEKVMSNLVLPASSCSRQAKLTARIVKVVFPHAMKLVFYMKTKT